MGDNTGMKAFIGRFFDAIEAGDIETVKASYAPNAVIWHNTDETETTREDNLKVLSGFVKAIPGRRYENRRVHLFDGGFVQQHDLYCQRTDGAEVVLPACLVCRVEAGVIVRLDEYFDSARVDRLTRRTV
jgi:ketosteroid isomerase-like protein